MGRGGRGGGEVVVERVRLAESDVSSRWKRYALTNLGDPRNSTHLSVRTSQSISEEQHRSSAR